jgi:hypothetical protein
MLLRVDFDSSLERYNEEAVLVNQTLLHRCHSFVVLVAKRIVYDAALYCHDGLL